MLQGQWLSFESSILQGIGESKNKTNKQTKPETKY